MPLQATSGAASYDAFGGGVPVVPAYIEEVFSTYLYTGNGSTQTITNGIDLSGKGGLVWFKRRSTAISHALFDSARSSTSSALFTNSTSAQVNSYGVTFNSNGVSLGQSEPEHNSNGETYVSWTFRKQPKFFDVVTYTGNGANGRNISHSLNATPACIIVKRTDSTSNWSVYHQGNIDGSGSGQNTYRLNTTSAGNSLFNVDRTSDTQFNVSDNSAGADSCNVNGGTYVAYLFASNAGGFGLTGTDNVISCGSFTTDGSANATVSLGYEPQWVMIKSSSNTGNWFVIDNMRNFSRTVTASLSPNLSNAEAAGFGDATYSFFPTATGFESVQDLAASQTYIYIAIRRGPMKVPTSGTSVFAPLARTGSGTNPTVVTTGTNPDLLLSFPRTASPSAYGTVFFDKLRGVSQILQSANTNAEATTFGTFCLQGFLNTGFQTGADFVEGYLNYSGSTYAQYAMTRAPSFFDEVCYTGTGSATTVTHNLGVVPELMIVKKRNTGGDDWYVYSQPTGNQYATYLNLSYKGDSGSSAWNSTSPTSSVFSLGASGGINGSGSTFVAYLFATCAGVSKCTSFTGTGTLQTIDCGFTAGSRFVLIKRTDSTGDWYVWDSSRGLSSSTDPYLLLNSTAAEVTSTNWVDTTSTGFQVTAASGNNVNINGASYIALAIA